MDISEKTINIPNQKNILANLAVSFNQLSSSLTHLSNSKVDQTFKISILESMFLNFRLIFEFFDKTNNVDDFDISDLFPNWQHIHIDEMEDHKKFINKNVMHFSNMRLKYDEEATLSDLWITISKMSVLSDKLKSALLEELSLADKELFNFFKFSQN